jgi:L-asparaginase, type I
MKRILLIATGGTIVSKLGKNGLKPGMNAEELLRYVPQSRRFCNVTALQLMNIDSTNMCPRDWETIASAVFEHYGQYDGFVICHGTDTLAFTAAVLSYMIQNSPKPIVLTGSQRPIDREDTDARTNLLDSLAYASDERSSGVSIVFDGKVIAGTRAKKTRTKSYNAFSSINFPELAAVRDGRVIRYNEQRCVGEPRFFRKLNSKVGVFKLIPGVPSDILDYYFQLFDAVVIESFGAGGIPDGEYYTFGEIIERRVREGKILVMCTQVPNEGSDMCVYEVGQSAKSRFEVLETYDMTLEAAVTKLMWILSLTHDRREVEALFYETVNFDILYR